MLVEQFEVASDDGIRDSGIQVIKVLYFRKFAHFSPSHVPRDSVVSSSLDVDGSKIGVSEDFLSNSYGQSLRHFGGQSHQPTE